MSTEGLELMILAFVITAHSPRMHMNEAQGGKSFA